MPEIYDAGGNPVTAAPSETIPPLSSISPEQVQGRINVLAPKYGVDPNFATAIAKQESNFNPNATSPVGAKGVFQLMPETAKHYDVANPSDPDQNIRGGLAYLSDLQKKHKGDKYKILAEYNAGPSHVNDKFEDLPAETQDYETKILGPTAATTRGSSQEIYDLNGKSLDVTKSPFAQPQATPQQVSAYKKSAQTFQGPGQIAYEAAHYAPEILGIAGGALGSQLGAPNVGAAAGSGVGEIIAGSAEHGVPNKEDYLRALEGAGLSYGMGKTLEGLGTLRRALYKSPVTKAQEAIESARQDITGGISSGPTQGAQKELEAKLQPIKSESDAAWEKVNSRMDKSSHVFDVLTGETDPTTGQPVTIPKTVRGPIKLSPDTLDYVDQEKQRLGTLLQAGVRDPKTVQAFQALNKISQGTVKDKSGDVYVDFDSAKSLRSQIGASNAAEIQANIKSGKRNINLQRGSSVQANLRAKLGDDIESSLQDIGGPDALEEYAKATGMTKTLYKASLFDKTLAKNTDYSSGNLNVDKAINEFTNPTSPIASKFSSTERNSIKSALLAAKNVSPGYDGALKFSNGAYTFYSAARHPVQFAVSIPAKYIYQKVIADPKYARVLAQLPSAPSKSAQAAMMTKSLLKGALQNAPAQMIAPSGMRIKDAHIDENGNPTPDFQMSRSQ